MSATDGGLADARASMTLGWVGGTDGHLLLLDQTLLPVEERDIDCRTIEQVWEAIRRLSVRGAPAIGVAAAYGVVLGLQSVTGSSQSEFDARLAEACEYLASSRPTVARIRGSSGAASPAGFAWCRLLPSARGTCRWAAPARRMQSRGFRPCVLRSRAMRFPGQAHQTP